MALDSESVLKAIEKTKETSGKRKFTQSIELIVNLRDVDPKKTENRIQELIELPHPVGKKKICVIASGEMALKARRGGADLILQRSELEALVNDRKKQRKLANTYDFFIAEAPLMPLVGRSMGAILGPRAKMPTPVSPAGDIEEQIGKHRKLVLIRLRGQPTLQCCVGNEKMQNEEIAENVQTVFRKIEEKLRRGMNNIKTVYIKTTMGSTVKVNM